MKKLTEEEIEKLAQKRADEIFTEPYGGITSDMENFVQGFIEGYTQAMNEYFNPPAIPTSPDFLINVVPTEMIIQNTLTETHYYFGIDEYTIPKYNKEKLEGKLWGLWYQWTHSIHQDPRNTLPWAKTNMNYDIFEAAYLKWFEENKEEKSDLLKGLEGKIESEMSDKEVVEYYYKHICPNDKWKEMDGRFFHFSEEHQMFFEHSGSDIFMAMRPAVLEHIKKNNLWKK
jgi:hypothetical protein